MHELMIDLALNDNTPMYEQIYEFIKNEIRNGRIGCRTRLPSTRALAAHLQISRSTVDMAYTQLISEGYIESVPCKGYFVSEISLLFNIDKRDDNTKQKKVLYTNTESIDFSPWGIDLESFPFNAWRKISKGLLSADNKEIFSSGDSKGEYSLRKTLCNYLYEARGVHCEPDRVIVGAGNEQLLMLLNMIFDDKPIIAMENPTYLQAYRLLKKSGNVIIPIIMDRLGIDIRELKSSHADVAYVMPSHQFPTGIVMPIKRRIELLQWANEKSERFIIEDDYDSEFRYHGKPIPALQGIDSNEKVIYMGTFSKSIAPAIRMSYMVLPSKLMEIYNEKMSFCSQTVSRIDQMIVDEFISKGYFERHLNKMRSIYKSKHDLLINELKECRKHISIEGENSGLHILIHIDNGMNEDKLISKAKANGVTVHAMSKYYIDEKAGFLKPTILLGFANLSENEIIEGISILKRVWRLN